MMENKRKLHVGCGDIYLDGWINIVIRKDVMFASESPSISFLRY
jgi:hypothetical protein